MLSPVTLCHRTANHHNSDMTNLSVWSKCGFFCFVFFRTPQSNTSLACHSSARTDTDTQGEGREFRGCVCISGRSSGSFCDSRGPRPVREGGQAGGILSPRAWVGSSSSQGGQREKEMKNYSLLLRNQRATSVRRAPASVRVCA